MCPFRGKKETRTKKETWMKALVTADQSKASRRKTWPKKKKKWRKEKMWVLETKLFKGML